MFIPDPFSFNDDYWMMLGLFPEDTQEPTEDPLGYDCGDQYDDEQRKDYDEN